MGWNSQKGSSFAKGCKGGEKGGGKGPRAKGANGFGNAWRMLQNDRWVPFEPGVHFRGLPGEEISYALDGEKFEATFVTEKSGVCVNVRTNSTDCVLHVSEIEFLARNGAFDLESGEVSPERCAESKTRLIANRHLLRAHSVAAMKAELKPKDGTISYMHGVPTEMVEDLRNVVEHDTWEGTTCGREWIHEWLTYGTDWLEEYQDTVAKARKNKLWCMVCSRQLHCDWSFEQHQSGKDHQKKLKGWDFRYGKPPPTPCPPCSQSTQPGPVSTSRPLWPRLVDMTRRESAYYSDTDVRELVDPWDMAAGGPSQPLAGFEL